jgi:DNA-binding NarL/FixJ family response regulator
MRVLLADDHALFRDGVASLLRTWGVEVVGEAADGWEALAQARLLTPDLILMDINMPRCNGLQATRLIKAELPAVSIVMLTVSEDEDDLFEAVKSGAEGYILKEVDAEEFGQLIAGFSNGRVPMSKRLADRILSEFVRGRGKDRQPVEEITDREREVLRLLATGATNREIAASLHLSEHTVNYHMKNILAKLHLRNRAQVVAYAFREGLIRPG